MRNAPSVGSENTELRLLEPAPASVVKYPLEGVTELTLNMLELSVAHRIAGKAAIDAHTFGETRLSPVANSNEKISQATFPSPVPTPTGELVVCSQRSILDLYGVHPDLCDATFAKNALFVFWIKQSFSSRSRRSVVVETNNLVAYHRTNSNSMPMPTRTIAAWDTATKKRAPQLASLLPD